MRVSITQTSLILALGAMLASGCSTGSDSDSSGTAKKFAVESINVLEGQTWQINRSIDIAFNKDVDFSTVNFNTINVIDDQGNGATGTFSQPIGANGKVNRSMVRFQPTCPREDDFSDAGLLPAKKYRLTVRGSKSGGTSVLTTAGEPLENGALVNFATPDSEDPQILFVDTTAGPPVVVVRGLNADPSLPATSLVLGGIEEEFLWSTVEQQAKLSFDVPLNHYSIEENQLQVLLRFNQAVAANSTNISTDFLELQYFDPGQGQFLSMQTRIELLENCTELGATVRVSPVGLVPQDSDLRIILRQGFTDLIGDPTSADLANFSRMHTVQAGDPNPLHPGVDNPEVDDVLEPFLLSGSEEDSLEDESAVFQVPAADWGDGLLAASFDFGGTGGPGGDFDWHLDPNTEVVLDTVSDTIQGGPGGAKTKTQAVINGIVDIRDLRIPQSSMLRIVGPNTCTILASGDVEVLGQILVNGADNPGVGTLNTTNQPEQGAKGQAGGGDGGVGSFLTTQSTPRGGAGFGAFGIPSRGGQGGETSYASTGKNDRRGAGGGGGRLGPDIYHLHKDSSSTPVRVQALVGLDAEPGAPGGEEGTGAVSQSERAQGGEIGPEPFFDNNPDNDFLGTMVVDPGGPNETLIPGELTGLHAGAGGGAGGDAVDSDSFPLIPFSAKGDEKGSGGGGGAGGLRILAIGNITVGSAAAPGFIRAEGGTGGGGENVIFFDRVGGGSGGGSGGHIVLSSAGTITIRNAADTGGFGWYRDDPSTVDHEVRSLSAVGGQGGAGNGSSGGSNEEGETPWKCDSIPKFYDEGLNDVPPFNENCFNNQPDNGDPSGFWTVGAGGDGSPGLVQLHVEDPDINLLFPDVLDSGTPYMSGQDVTDASAPPPLGWIEPGTKPNRMTPFFGRKSRARSKWIPLGLARVDPGGLDQVVLQFDGSDPGTGVIPNDGTGSVDLLPPILGPQVIANPTFDVTLDASGLAPGDELYTENARLLKRFTVKLEDSTDPSTFQHFVITDASYDEALDEFHLSLDPNGENPAQFEAGGSINAFLVPHFLRVVTNDVDDAYPEETEIVVTFDATVLDPDTGLPSKDQAHGSTADITDLNSNHWDFFRFEVEFDIAKDDTVDIDITVPRPALDHLRVHFTF